MRFDRVETPDGSPLMVFESPRMIGVRCQCGSLATHCCDQPIIHDLRCNRPLCLRCVRRIGELDICPQHARFRGPEAAQEELRLDVPANPGEMEDSVA